MSQPDERDLDAADADLDQPPGRQAAAAERACRRTSSRTAAGSFDTSNAVELLRASSSCARRRPSSRCSVASTRFCRPLGERPFDHVEVLEPLLRRGLSAGTTACPGTGPAGSSMRKASYWSPRKPPRAGHWPGRMLTCRGMSTPADGQLVAADRADGRVDHRRVRAEAGLHRVRAALVVALLADHRPDEGDRPHLLGRALQARGELDALDGGVDGPGAGGDVGAGVRVERLELARPALHPEHDDRRGRRLLAAWRLGGAGQQVADAASATAAPAEAGAAAGTCGGRAPGDGHQWFHENSVELISAQNRSSSCCAAARATGPPASVSKWAASSGVGRRVRTVRYADLDRLRVVRGDPGDPASRRSTGPALIRSRTSFAVHQQQPLRDRAAAAVELVLAGVAVALDELVLLPCRASRTRMCDSASMVATDAAWSTLPATCSGRSRVSGNTAQAFSSVSPTLVVGGAVEAEHLASMAMTRISRRRSKPWAAKSSARISGPAGPVPPGSQVVHRLDQRPAEHQGPDAVDRGPGEVRVLRVRHPRGQPLAAGARRRAAAPARTAPRLDDRLRSSVLRSSTSYSPSAVVDAA